MTAHRYASRALRTRRSRWRRWPLTDEGNGLLFLALTGALLLLAVVRMCNAEPLL